MLTKKQVSHHHHHLIHSYSPQLQSYLLIHLNIRFLTNPYKLTEYL